MWHLRLPCFKLCMGKSTEDHVWEILAIHASKCLEMPRNVTSAHLPLVGTPSLDCHLATPNSRDAGKWRVSGGPRRCEISSGKLAISNSEQRNNSLYTKQKMESIRRTSKSSQVDWRTRQEPAECWVGSREQEGLMIWPECRGSSAF